MHEAKTVDAPMASHVAGFNISGASPVLRPRLWHAGIVLAAMPALSFGLQFWLCWRNETLSLLFSHFTVSYIDWIFVAFNLFVVHAIDWRRGGALLVAMTASLVFNAAVHAYWQNALSVNGGHMVGPGHVLLPAGWVHLCYATVQMTLILAFLFVRRNRPLYCGALTALCAVYFVGAGISGYIMNHGIMLTDALMVTGGLACLLIFPRIAYGPRARTGAGVNAPGSQPALPGRG